jgi:hypothetical protein
MNCREAQSQIFAERDGALDNALRVALDGHLATCDGCRRNRENLTAALTGWRIQITQVTVPDAEREWHAVRRRIRGGVEAGAVRATRPRRSLFTWIAVPVGAAAAAALALWVPSRPTSGVPLDDHSGAHVARANSIDVTGNKAPTMIFVDDKSGWTFVWASEGKRG